MRRLLTFECEGASLGATIDEAGGKLGVLFVTGGTQTRIGSHRMSERLAASLAEAGMTCFRYDRRGVGDSEGRDPGWRGSAPDIAAAAATFRRHCPEVRHITGFGLCDGATALALFGADASIDAFILTNPWMVESEADAPPAAAIKYHYRQRLLSLAGWKDLLTGAVSYRKLLRGFGKLLYTAPKGLEGEVAEALGRAKPPLQLILAQGDATAIAARAAWDSAMFKAIKASNPPPDRIESDSHTFARPGDMDRLLDACLTGLARFSGSR